MMGFCKTTRFNGMEAAQISLNELKAADKAISEILSCAQQLVEGAKQAAKQGGSFDSLERDIWSKVRQIGFAAMELFIRLQGQGRQMGQTNGTGLNGIKLSVSDCRKRN